MAFRPSDLQEAFFVPGNHAYRVWGYGTLDALEEVLRPGYFVGTLLRPWLIVMVPCTASRLRLSGFSLTVSPPLA